MIVYAKYVSRTSTYVSVVMLTVACCSAADPRAKVLLFCGTR
jgi:hypothetical protein